MLIVFFLPYESFPDIDYHSERQVWMWGDIWKSQNLQTSPISSAWPWSGLTPRFLCDILRVVGVMKRSDPETDGEDQARGATGGQGQPRWRGAAISWPWRLIVPTFAQNITCFAKLTGAIYMPAEDRWLRKFEESSSRSITKRADGAQSCIGTQ